MSFLFEDKEFLSQILKSAQQAQPAPTAEPDTAGTDKDAVIQAAMKLVQNLRDDMAGKLNFTSTRENADLSTAHLVNLDELFNFLEFNGIKANGRALVLNARQYRDDASGKMTNLVQQMGEAGKAYSRYPAQGVAQYYVLRDAVAGYLQDLNQSADNNPMLKAMLAKLNAALNSSIPSKTRPNTDVAGNSTTPSANPQQNGQNVKQPGGDVNQKIQSLMTNLPFDLRNIDFNRINRFLNGVANLVIGTNQEAVVQRLVNQIREEQKNFSTNFMVNGETVFPLGMNPADYVNMLKDKTKQYLPALDSLGKILNGTRSVFAAFDAQYSANLEAYKNQIDGQIGATYTDDSIYFENVTALRTLARAGNIATKPGVK